MRVTLIHNPSAGAGNTSADELRTALRRAGVPASYCPADDPGLSAALRAPADLVVAAGGDGTVARVVTELPDRRIPITILPLGTANNIARTFGIAGEPSDLVAGWRHAAERRLDVGAAVGPWGRRRFVESVGLGALVAVTMELARAEKVPSTERAGRARSTLRRVLAVAEPLRLEITVGGQELEEDLLLLEAMNIAYAGSGLHLAPEADPGDRHLDLVCLAPGQRDAMLTWLDAAEPASAPPVSRRRGRELTLAWSDGPLQVDDDFPETTECRCTIELEPDPVRVLVPAVGKRIGGGHG
jgi:diacylglycerol kinase family enzyme